MTLTQASCPTPARPSRRWFAPRVLGVGAGSGLLGGLCCIASAIAVGSGLGGLSVAGSLMDRYQPYFIAASMLMMAWWLLRTLRAMGRRPAGRGTVAVVAGAVGRQLAPMGIVYAGTLLVTMAVSRLAGVG
jgi:hypothetical protein